MPVEIFSVAKNITGNVIVKTFFGYDFSPLIDGKELSMEVTHVTDAMIKYSFNPLYMIKLALLGYYADRILINSTEKSISKRIDKLREIASEAIDKRANLRKDGNFP